MRKPSLKNPRNYHLVYIAYIVFFLFISVGTSVAESYYNSQDLPAKKKGKSFFDNIFKKDNRPIELHADDVKLYRSQGFEAQKRGEFDTALTYYLKAVELDPKYAVVYNDLGVLYEARGENTLAEESYFKSISADPSYLSPYSNLAMFYENKRDLRKAAFYWKKRSELGSLDDPWTGRAKARYDAIRMTMASQNPSFDMREQEILTFSDEVNEQKALCKTDNKQYAIYALEKAKTAYHEGRSLEALKEAAGAQQIDPDNDEVNAFIDKLRSRLLTR